MSEVSGIMIYCVVEVFWLYCFAYFSHTVDGQHNESYGIW